ncbi:MAG TPA: serine/threonine-protein kinase, partial [Acidimicrobiales bacterium]|nr:serine/threonine-protein kinase [Acidimicrobiales bacterium]
MATTTTVGGRYELLRVIGRGGMADVWEAEDTTLGRRVALKVLRAGDPALAARLEREARALATLDHPGLVRLLDAGEDAGRPYVVTELVAGPTVAHALRSDPPGPAQVAAVGSQVAAALAYVHRAGIVHRDVKPSNILLDEGGRARLADFGIAQLGDASGMTATGTTVGTVAYMAPEQLEGNRVGPP